MEISSEAFSRFAEQADSRNFKIVLMLNPLGHLKRSEQIMFPTISYPIKFPQLYRLLNNLRNPAANLPSSPRFSNSSPSLVTSSNFILTPRSRSSANSRSISTPNFSSLDKKALRILCAEDNEINRKILLKMLTKLDYHEEDIEFVENGKEALDTIIQNNTIIDNAALSPRIEDSKNKSLPEIEVPPNAFDVILMDVFMPVMDGLESTLQIRKLTQVMQPCIIALTANAMRGDDERCKSAGMDLHLSKPVDLNALEMALAQARIFRAKRRLSLNGREHQISHSAAKMRLGTPR
eukprot:TRINITY_DN2556_c1_g1_i6.p1 TRINITY_DN2556_c1_g1~~TRINITY_DN2556_c1_g1_i6.p1  ORF type:complete len:293 (-),score=89.98 TRINITY_DN2556_c1_g1_i6:20-898(-)